MLYSTTIRNYAEPSEIQDSAHESTPEAPSVEVNPFDLTLNEKLVSETPEFKRTCFKIHFRTICHQAPKGPKSNVSAKQSHVMKKTTTLILSFLSFFLLRERDLPERDLRESAFLLRFREGER